MLVWESGKDNHNEKNLNNSCKYQLPMTPQALGQAFSPHDVLTSSRQPSKVSIIILPVQTGDVTLEAWRRSPLSPPNSGAGILSVVPSRSFPVSLPLLPR